MQVSEFKKLPIIGILRGIEEDQVEPLVETITCSGLKTIEVTMNTPAADKIIKKMVKAVRGKLTIGAGTVLDLTSLKKAVDCGATFIVMPVLIKKVVSYCVKHKIPVFPGALTPTEIYQAQDAGATMVKVFPAKFFGPEYFKEIKGPFNNIELLACGGVTPENIKTFFTCGASAVAFGASVFKKEWLRDKQFSQIGKSIEVFVKAAS